MWQEIEGKWFIKGILQRFELFCFVWAGVSGIPGWSQTRYTVVEDGLGLLILLPKTPKGWSPESIIRNTHTHTRINTTGVGGGKDL